MDQSDDDPSDNELHVQLPCDLPMWPDICELLHKLDRINTSSEIGNILADIEVFCGSNESQCDLTQANTIEFFLDEICGPEEKEIICSILMPAIASFALNISKCKPYIGVIKMRTGESDMRNVHGTFFASLLAHSFLSTTGKRSLNLNLLRLDPQSPVTHWKLRCYFHHFHQILQRTENRNTSICKEHCREVDCLEDPTLASRSLVRFLVSKENPNVDEENVLRLKFHENFSLGVLVDSSPLNSLYSMKNLESILPFLFVDELTQNECVQVTLPFNHLLSFAQKPDFHRSRQGVNAILNHLLAGIKPCDSYRENLKSELRRPSVAAVTSAESESEIEETKDSSQLSLSLSDSCVHNQTDSELSYNLSDREKKADFGRKNKLKRKETFNERLKAALERGNTPDESDDPSVRVRPVHLKKVLRRQRSTGFRAFNDNFDESEDFFTATEDELSFAPVKSEKESQQIVKNAKNTMNPLIRRKILQDKSFDLSTSSPQITSPSLPVSSLKTGSSDIFSDSSSFSSEGLGMPNMDEGCMEDLCDNLKGCIETSEGGLDFRNVELKRAVKGLGIRCLSDSYIASIGDMDQFQSLKSSQKLKISENLEGNIRGNISLSCPNLLVSTDWCEYVKEVEQVIYKSVVSEGIEGNKWEQQVWSILLWIAASLTDHVQEITFNAKESPELEDLETVVELVLKHNVTCQELLQKILDTLDGEENDVFSCIRKHCENLTSL